MGWDLARYVRPPWPGLAWPRSPTHHHSPLTTHQAMMFWLVSIFATPTIISAMPMVAPAGAESMVAPLEWHPSLPNSVHDLSLPVPGQTTWLTLTDAPVIRYSKLEQKYQVFQLSQLVDFTDLSLAGQNLKTQLSRFSGKTTEVFQEFFSRSTFMHEFYIKDDLSFLQCQTVCIAKSSTLVQQSNQLLELNVLTSRYDGYTWVDSMQNHTGQDYNIFWNTLRPSMIFPQNNLHNGTVEVFQINNQVPVPVEDIGHRQFYFDPTSGEYYRSEMYRLHVRFNNKRDVQILIPNLATSQTSEFELSRCVCVRDISENLKHTLVANNIAAFTRSTLSPEISNIEAQRLVDSGSQTMDSVENLLKSHTLYTNSENRLIHPSQLYPLHSDQPVHDQGQVNLERDWHEQDTRSTSSNRQTRLAGLASLGSTVLWKAVAFTAPYVLDKQKDILHNFGKEIQGSFLLDSNVNQNWSSPASWQRQVDFSLKDSPISMEFQNDGVNLQLRDEQPQLQKYDTPNIQLAQVLEKTGGDLAFVKDQIFPEIPKMLLSHVLPRLSFPIRENSQVLVEIEKAATFWRVKFFFECKRTDLDFTKVEVQTLPHVLRENTLYKAEVPVDQLSVTQNPSLHHDITLRQSKCADLLLSHTPEDILSSCGELPYQSKVVTEIFSLDEGSLWLISGPAKLTYQCSLKTAVTELLSKQFNVLFIHTSCDFSISNKGITFQQARSSQLQSIVPVLHILSYDAPVQVSSAEWRLLWLSLITTIAVSTFLGFIGLSVKAALFMRSHPWWSLWHVTPRTGMTTRPHSPPPPSPSSPSSPSPASTQEEVVFSSLQDTHNAGVAAKFASNHK